MRDFWTRTRGLDQQIPALSLNFQFIVEQFVTKHHIKEIHQTQEGMKTILRGVHYPDGHQKLPVNFLKFCVGVFVSVPSLQALDIIKPKFLACFSNNNSKVAKESCHSNWIQINWVD